MAENQTECFRLEQRSVIKFLMAKKYKPNEIHRRKHNVYKEACFSKKNVYKWAKHDFSAINLSQKDSPWSWNIAILW